MTDLKQRMQGAVNALTNEFNGLRTGRASPDLLKPVHVEVYGSKMPLDQVGTINVVDARMLSVQVWDQSQVQTVEKAIRESGLGLNPQTEGNLIRIPLPELNEERRKELLKVAGKYAEDARIAVRNIRRDGMDTIKKEEGLSEDDVRREEGEVQKLTDEHVKKIDEMLVKKEADIMQV